MEPLQLENIALFYKGTPEELAQKFSHSFYVFYILPEKAQKKFIGDCEALLKKYKSDTGMVTIQLERGLLIARKKT